MIRKRDRVVGTLAVWVGVLITMGMLLDRMNIIPVYLQNAWYYTGSVVTGASSEEALQILQDLQSISNQYYTQTQQFARMELLAYFPLVAILCAVLIVAAVVSTYFIWRSVAVSAEVTERIEARKSANVKPATSLATLLNEDGEIITARAEKSAKSTQSPAAKPSERPEDAEQPEIPEEPETNHRRK